MRGFAIDLFERIAWNLPLLALYFYGLWYCRINKAKNLVLARYASFCFTLFAMTALLSSINKAWFSSVAEGVHVQSMVRVGSIYAVTSALVFAVDLCGWWFFILAIKQGLKTQTVVSNA